jgi:hypothetical protein
MSLSSFCFSQRPLMYSLCIDTCTWVLGVIAVLICPLSSYLQLQLQLLALGSWLVAALVSIACKYIPRTRVPHARRLPLGRLSSFVRACQLYMADGSCQLPIGNIDISPVGPMAHRHRHLLYTACCYLSTHMLHAAGIRGHRARHAMTTAMTQCLYHTHTDAL